MKTSAHSCGKIIKYPKIKLTKNDIVKIAGIAIVIGLLLSIQAPVFALTEGPAEILVQTPSGMQPNTPDSTVTTNSWIQS